jgi:hypothetical protein
MKTLMNVLVTIFVLAVTSMLSCFILSVWGCTFGWSECTINSFGTTGAILLLLNIVVGTAIAALLSFSKEVSNEQRQ